MFDAYIKEIKIAVGITIFLAAIAGTWKLTSVYYQGKIATTNSERDAAVTTAVNLQLQAVHDAGEQHAKDQLALNNANAKLRSLQHNTTASCGKTQTGKSPDGTSRVAIEDLDGYIAISPAAANQIKDIGQRCAQLNIDTIQLNNSF